MFLQVGSSVAEIVEEGVELFGLRVDCPCLLVKLFKPEGVGKLDQANSSTSRFSAVKPRFTVAFFLPKILDKSGFYCE